MSTATATVPTIIPSPPTPRELADLANTLSVARDETRLRILYLLAAEPAGRNVTAICGHAGGSQPNVSHHLSFLRVSGLAEPRRDGQRVVYALTGRGRALVDALAGFVGAEREREREREREGVA